MITKTFFLILFFLSSIFFAFSQINPFQSSIDKFQSEVKQLDQFFKRFNNEENLLTGNEKSQTEIIKEMNDSIKYRRERKYILCSLFNLKDSCLISNKFSTEFINYVCNDSKNISLNYKDQDWFATVLCSINFKNKIQEAILTLKIEKDKNYGYKWVIVGSSTNYINVTPNRKDTSKFISPMNHELGFMDLRKVFDDYKNISEYTSADYKPSNIDLFLYHTKTKEIQFIKVISIKYHFLQLEPWIFTVDFFNRTDNNSGWLISSILNADTVNKERYKKEKLFLIQ